MKIYTAKLRIFPPRDELDSWFSEEPTTWEWDEPDYLSMIHTEYGRRIRDEKNRPGVSVKLRVIAEDDAPEDPADWDWGRVIGEWEYEFVRGVLIEEIPPGTATCYECGTRIVGKPWTDGDGDMFCSSTCIDNCNGEGAYRVTPDGDIIPEKEE